MAFLMYFAGALLIASGPGVAGSLAGNLIRRHAQPKELSFHAEDKNITDKKMEKEDGHEAVVIEKNSTGKVEEKKEEKDSCMCEFKGECNCENALNFMDCISASCASGECGCHEHQYHNACVDMSNTCLSLNFQCSGDKATCSMVVAGVGHDLDHKSTEELQKDLSMKLSQKCKYEESEKKGWHNADNRLRELEPEIEDHVKTLKARNEAYADPDGCGDVMIGAVQKKKNVTKPEKPEKPEPAAKGSAAGAALALSAACASFASL